MAADDPIPSFLSLKKTRRPLRTRPSGPPPPQLAFDLTPPEPAPAHPAARPLAAPTSLAADFPAPAPVPIPRVVPAKLEPIIYTVRQLIAELRQHLEGAYTGSLHVEGEISNCRPAASGHLYFTLKDGDAQLPVVLFRRQAMLMGFTLKDGMAVEARGRISLYETRGQLQLIAETLRPRGEGALQAAFEQLKRKLRAEGLFDRPRRPLPAFPHCIGIVTSTGGAALHDIIQVVRRRHARLNLLIYPAVVQGPQCPSSVIRGLRWFNRHPERVDLVILARGGGSLEDLAGFNDEALAREIAASRLPVVAAIGHEIDHTIADFVADLRAPTPSAAAELVTAAQHRIEERVASLERRVRRAGEFQMLRARRRLERLSAAQVLQRVRDSISLRQQKVDELRFRLAAAFSARERRRLRVQTQRLAALETRLRRHDPTLRISLASHRMENTESRLKRLAGELITRRATRLAHSTARLQTLSPLAVLNRGYAIVYREDGSILRSAAQAAAGQPIRARLAQGSVRATITETQTENQTQ